MFFGTCACKYATYSRIVGHIVLYGNELHRLLISLIKKSKKERDEDVTLTANVNVWEQRMLYGYGFSCNLKTLIHKRISKNKVGYAELIAEMRIDRRSQQSVQVCRVDQLPLLLESMIP